MQYLITARTDIGRLRSNNEDSILAEPAGPGPLSAALVAVADGMGGYYGGGVASKTVIDTLRDNLSNLYTTPTIDADWDSAMRRGFVRTRAALHAEIVQDPDLGQMGSTLTCLGIAGGEVTVAHVGDSRAYIFRDQELVCLTRDHTVAQDLLDEGKITADQMRDHPERNILTLFLSGDGAAIIPEVHTSKARTGDIYLVCSDGLHTMVTDAEIREALQALAPASSQASIDGLAATLIEMANAAGGVDNISAALVQCL